MGVFLQDGFIDLICLYSGSDLWGFWCLFDDFCDGRLQSIELGNGEEGSIGRQVLLVLDAEIELLRRRIFELEVL